MIVENLQHRNYNLDLLKMLCVFLVIVVHFGSKCPPFFANMMSLPVPVFMILSFYFFAQKISEMDIKKRLYRLLIPLVGWSIIYFIIYEFILQKDVGIGDFLWQSVMGHSPKLNTSMWFSNNLVILTVFAFFLFKKFENYLLKIMLYVLFIAYVLQYTGINYKFFNDLRYELKYPLGRLTEMLPYMVVGIVLAKYDVLKRLKSKWILHWAVLFIFINKWIQISGSSGFGYAGIKLSLLSVLLILFFSSIPEGKDKVKKVLSVVTQNSMGIYCIHRLIEALLHPYFFTEKNFGYCLLIFLVSWLVCYAISKIPLRIVRALVK